MWTINGGVVLSRKYLVYKHTAPNGKVYIGITSQSPQRRFNNGRGYYHNDHFKRAIEKYGWKGFSHEILTEDLNARRSCFCGEKD